MKNDWLSVCRQSLSPPPLPQPAGDGGAGSRRNRNGGARAAPFHETQTVGEDGW